MKKLLTLCFFLTPLINYAQSSASTFGFRYDQRPTVSINGHALLNPWVGGLNATQYATMALNTDNRDDLVVYDRTTNKISTFVAIDNPTGSGIAWQYAPEYESAFPTINGWLALIDYDADGKKDLFSPGPSGNISVYHNDSQNGQVRFGLAVSSLTTVGFGGKQNLYVSPTDSPAVTDFDDDGDVDILTFDSSGNLITYQQNMSVERTGNKGGLDFQRAACQVWGHFIKEYCNDFTFGIACDGSVVGQSKSAINLSKLSATRPQHSGNTLTVLDANGDGRKDMLFGFVTCDNIAVLYNAGTNNENASFTSFDSLFPAQNPVKFPAYAATYWEDVDGDGAKDLLASTYSDANENQAYDFRASGWYYHNAGTNQKPDFKLVQKDFLQSEMLELGERAAPALADLDGDGDLDLLIGYSGVRSGTAYRAGLWHFENKGTTQNPAFSLVTTDYLGLTQGLGFSEVVPSLTDVDGNGSVDLVVTGASAKGAEIRVFFNTAAKGAATQYSLSNVTQWPNPGGVMLLGELLTVTDVDRDGRPDVLIGKNEGTINYYRNTGTAASPVFQLQNQTFGGFTNDNSYYDRARSLVIADLNGDQKNEIIAASNNGKVRIYQFPDRPDQAWTLLDSLPSLSLPGTGLIAAAGDLDGDQLPDLMLGSQAGGLRYLKNTSQKVVVTGVTEEVTGPWVFPNPTDRFLTVRPVFAGKLELMSLSGQLVLPVQEVRTDEETVMDLGNLPDGTYLLRLSAANHPAQVQKVVVWK